MALFIYRLSSNAYRTDNLYCLSGALVAGRLGLSYSKVITCVAVFLLRVSSIIITLHYPNHFRIRIACRHHFHRYSNFINHVHALLLMLCKAKSLLSHELPSLGHNTD